jgi:MFS family permease
MGTVQSAWAVGWGGAVLLYAVVTMLLPPDLAWRVMFGIGILPAFLIVYVRRNIAEPTRGPLRNARHVPGQPNPFAIFRPDVLRATIVGGLVGVGAHGGYYALMTWLPTYLKTERHLSVLATSGYLAIVIVAFWCGCIASAWLMDRLGRRPNLVIFAACCVVTVLAYVFMDLSDAAMLFLGFPLGFFAAGIPASLGALFNELYPSDMRGAGVGFCYNFGRIVSAGFPLLVGHMSSSMPLGTAIGVDAGLAYALVVVAVLALPETRGKALQHDASSDTARPPLPTSDIR